MSLNKGFSLVELMIVVAILGILYAVALPAYSDFIQDGRRADVQQTLLQEVAVLERFYTRQGGYPGVYSVDSTEFYSFSYSPSSSSAAENDNYDSTTFTLTATPVAGSSQADDPCGALTIDYKGDKTNSTSSSSGCWGN